MRIISVCSCGYSYTNISLQCGFYVLYSIAPIQKGLPVGGIFKVNIWIVCLLGVLRRFQHCTGHITTGSWKGRGNQYIEFARVVYCKLPTNGKQLPAFPLEPMWGSNPGLRGGRRECYHSATVAPNIWIENSQCNNEYRRKDYLVRHTKFTHPVIKNVDNSSSAFVSQCQDNAFDPVKDFC